MTRTNREVKPDHEARPETKPVCARNLRGYESGVRHTKASFCFGQTCGHGKLQRWWRKSNLVIFFTPYHLMIQMDSHYLKGDPSDIPYHIL